MADKKIKLGIIAAMAPEIDILKGAVSDRHIDIVAGTEYITGTIGNYDVVFMQCGIGMVSAAMGTQAMISAYHPDYIINTGCAGGLSQEVNVGDIVLADSLAEWNLDTMAIGNPRGYITALDRVELDTDMEFTEKVAATFDKETKIHKGMIVSGDQFISRNDQRQIILDAFPRAMCAEMEGAAIGHVCVQNNVPFGVIRCISDNANGDSEVDFPTFSAAVSEKLAGYLLEFLRNHDS